MATLLFALLMTCPKQAGAQEMPVPVPTQLSLFYRILTFDREYEPKAPGRMVVGVLYQGRFRASELAKIALENAVAAAAPPPGGETVEVVSIDLSRTSEVHEAVRRAEADFLYLAPLRAVDLREIVAASRSLGVLSVTGVPEYLGEGVAVGIGSEGGRPQILIDLEAAVAQGADFSSELLKLAEIISGPQLPQ